MKYAQATQFLDRLVNYEKKPGPRDEFKLDNIRRLVRLAGDPQRKLKNVVLVAGTKGKGSVCYMLESALRACGLSTGMFVSPHVSTVRERIQLLGSAVSEQQFASLVERLRPLVSKARVSFFELTAAMAFELFAREKPDYTILEVGLGGRLDATNITEPDVSVITRIGLDHVQVLGGTVRKIAREKAGIMRTGRPVVVGWQTREAADELARQARRTGAEYVSATEQVRIWDVEHSPNGVDFSMLSALGACRIGLPLLGKHQAENCATVLAVLGVLAHEDSRIKLDRVAAGLAEVRIPARCQVVQQEPTMIVDSCHNPDSGQALAGVIASHLRRKVILVYGSLAGKLVAKTVAPLVPWIERAVLVRPNSPRAEEMSVLKRVFSRLGIEHTAAHSIREALQTAEVLSGGEVPIVVAGSFYLAGEVLSALGLGKTGHR